VAQKDWSVVGQLAKVFHGDDGELAAARRFQIHAKKLGVDFDQIGVPGCRWVKAGVKESRDEPLRETRTLS
jgi:hypothetical protein